MFGYGVAVGFACYFWEIGNAHEFLLHTHYVYVPDTYLTYLQTVQSGTFAYTQSLFYPHLLLHLYYPRNSVQKIWEFYPYTSKDTLGG